MRRKALSGQGRPVNAGPSERRWSEGTRRSRDGLRGKRFWLLLPRLAKVTRREGETAPCQTHRKAARHRGFRRRGPKICRDAAIPNSRQKKPRTSYGEGEVRSSRSEPLGRGSDVCQHLTQQRSIERSLDHSHALTLPPFAKFRIVHEKSPAAGKSRSVGLIPV